MDERKPYRSRSNMEIAEMLREHLRVPCGDRTKPGEHMGPMWLRTAKDNLIIFKEEGDSEAVEFLERAIAEYEAIYGN